MSRIRRLTAACLVTAALAPAAANAYPLDDGPPSDPPSRELASGEITPAPATSVAEPSGFDWGDAGAGFAAAAGLSMIAAGTAVGVRARRRAT
jgi:hypothetical protein